MDFQAFYQGQTADAYQFFGAHPHASGTQFRVYAPAASRVTLMGEFTDWQEIDMQRNSQFYEYNHPAATPGQLYHYCIYDHAQNRVRHCDPYGFSMELRPGLCSRIVNLEDYTFHDQKWMKKRTRCFHEPLNIYELHFGSWRTNPDAPNGWYTYEELAAPLITYLKQNHYTHVEFMPLSEHPFDGSWGYQNTGFFSPTSRYGTPHQLKSLIDQLHQAGLGAILDFVPIHFAVDSYGLHQFDGTALYEYPHHDVGESEWGTYNFIHSRPDVCSFLQSAANYWLTEYHFDGLRMDAISRALYWQGDPARGVNHAAAAFLRNMNQTLHELHPSAMLIAEDSTSYPGVTASAASGGLDFDYKWDLGWMNDTLDYFKKAPQERPQHYHKLTFSMMYYYNERYLLPFSHDENVHGKGTILQKMQGEYEDKFPQGRALYLYMMTHPGKKLNFMGNEIGQLREWDESREQDWNILRYPNHDSFYHYLRKLNELYITHPALYAADHKQEGFHWADCHEEALSVYAFLRHTERESLLAVFNFSDEPRDAFSLTLAAKARPALLLCSDEECFGGKTADPKKLFSYQKGQLILDLPPFSGLLFKL